MIFLAIDVGNTRLKWALYDAPHANANLLAQGAEFLENIEKLADGLTTDHDPTTGDGACDLACGVEQGRPPWQLAAQCKRRADRGLAHAQLAREPCGADLACRQARLDHRAHQLERVVKRILAAALAYNALAIGFGPTDRASEAICSLAVFPRWVSFFLMQGARLPDPHHLLKGKGNFSKSRKESSSH